MIHKIFSLLFFCLLFQFGFSQGTYNGDKLLEILGKQRDSSEVYKTFAREWMLGKKTFLVEKGIKITKNPETNKVMAITFAGKGFEIGDNKFQKYIGTIPFSLSVDDSYDAIRQKLGAPKKELENISKFTKNGLSVIVTFKNNAHSKIECIKIALGFGQTEYDPSLFESQQVAVSNSNTNSNTHSTINNSHEPTEQEMREKAMDAKMNEHQQTPKSNSTNNSSNSQTSNATPTSKNTTSNTSKTLAVDVMPAVFDNAPSKPAPKLANKSELYRTLMEAMEAGSETSFQGIQNGVETPFANFWDYKHCFKTNINIPNSKYNFIYSFPFANSQKDWVAVIKEGPFDENFKTTYNDFLEKMKKDFPTSEGWKHSFPRDEDPNFPLKDFEVQNAKFGSVILDYHKNPAGASVLYLRLLLYYD